MRQLAIAVGVACLACALGVAAPARADVHRSWVKAIPDAATWKQYSKVVGSDELGKCIIDVKTNDLYFFDVNLFPIHADFVLGQLLHESWTADHVRAFNLNYEARKPSFILCYVTHHLKVDKWTLSFWEGDQITARDIVRVVKRLEPAFFMRDLRFRPDSPAQQLVAKDVARRGVAILTNDELYHAAEVQAFHTGRAIGKLRVVPLGTPYESVQFDRRDIVLLQESYPDITPVAGILATQFSTPLSHVNLRAGAWGIPNAGDKRARAKYGALDGKIVYYEVGATQIVLRAATPAETEEMTKQVLAAHHVESPEVDLGNRRFAMLTRMRARDVGVYGTKASNLGEIVTANVPGVRVPMGFGVPFHFYAEHMKRSGLDARVVAMLANPQFARDPAWRKRELESLRAAIQAAPIDPDTLDAIYRRVRLSLGGAGVFVRSSSNAEDLPGFNGAGLYDTMGNVRGKRQLGEALRFVWASLWNQRAVEEREAFGIDHRQVYMAVLVQIGINATAAGVLVTKDLFDPSDDHSFTINAKWGLGERVVQGQRSPEQIVFDPTNDGTKIVSRSDDPIMLTFDEHGGTVEKPVPPGQDVILTEARAKRLATMVAKLVPVFTHGQPLDIEWVLDGDEFWIVQARPLVTK